MNPLIAGALLIWALAWKGFALWKAAQLQHRNWFVAILVLNTLGLLEIIYLFGIARKYSVEVVEK
ncbi:MAG: hypothetical protein JWN89_619 [Parcubacteria group bacterium]|nr:hypothetical protein [Parcubacteria group bacterium]